MTNCSYRSRKAGTCQLYKTYVRPCISIDISNDQIICMGNSLTTKNTRLTLILVQVKPVKINLGELALRKPDKLDHARAKMANSVVIKNYFDTPEKVLPEDNLMY